VVAEHADIWNCPATTPEELTRKSGILDEHCAAVGRNPGEIVRSQQLLVARDGAARARDQILAFIAAGATHLVLAVLPPPSGAPAAPAAQWLAEEIVEPVLGQVT
jgi:alkanesulfonate monooxygenase SsuD/methylene tetrahydromethanopterin reductase-like flavin-dependent oxidoreductase (luciferase family)